MISLSFGSTRLGQGREKARDFLMENRDILAEIEGKGILRFGEKRKQLELQKARKRGDSSRE